MWGVGPRLRRYPSDFDFPGTKLDPRSQPLAFKSTKPKRKSGVGRQSPGSGVEPDNRGRTGRPGTKPRDEKPEGTGDYVNWAVRGSYISKVVSLGSYPLKGHELVSQALRIYRFG